MKDEHLEASAAFQSTFIYDWYDGPTMGAALDQQGQTVVFLEAKTLNKDVRAFLLMPLDPELYDDLKRTYGEPPQPPNLGIVLPVADPDDPVDPLVAVFETPKDGRIILCKSDVTYALVSQVFVSAHVMGRLLRKELPGRIVDRYFKGVEGARNEGNPD